MSTRQAVSHSQEIREQASRCPICWDERTDPVVTPCEHTFCMACIKVALHVNGKFCPVCRAPISSHRSLAVFVPAVKVLDEAMTSSGPGLWACQACTFVNPLADGRCGACAARRPSTVVPPSVRARGSTCEIIAPHDDHDRRGVQAIEKHESSKRRKTTAATATVSSTKAAACHADTDADDANDDVANGDDDDHQHHAHTESGSGVVAGRAPKRGPGGGTGQSVGRCKVAYEFVRGPKMSEEEARRLAAAEGLVLIPAPGKSKTGLEGVTPVMRADGRAFAAADRRAPKGTPCTHFGIYSSKWEAALTVARHFGPEACRQKTAMLTEAETRRLATAEGLSLVPSVYSTTGFRGVRKVGYGYVVETSAVGGATVIVGNYLSVWEAALAYARAVGTDKCRSADPQRPTKWQV